MIFTEKIQDYRQVATALAVIVNQEDFGFTPHNLFTDPGVKNAPAAQTSLNPAPAIGQ
jgi:hypothetical protein